MRITAVAAICFCIIGISTGADAQAAIRQQTNIPAQGLGPALQVLAKDRNLQVVYRSEVIGKLRTSGAVGELTTDEAVTELLKGTGLTFHYLGENAITIMSVGSGASAVSLPTSSMAIPSSVPSTDDQQPQEGKKSLWANFLLAQASSGSAPGGSSVVGGAQSSSERSDSSSQLTEILVTAQKTGVAERLQDVPVPISVVSAQSLMESNKAGMQDYFDQIPGLSVGQDGSGLTIVSIRGITTGQNTNPTVGFTLDDVPLGASTSSGGIGQLPFINPADLAQVEVLRGPQGTLYGDNSMGGLIRYVTVDPSTDRIFGDVRVGGDSVFGGTHLGYNTSAAINVPLSDTLAIRASAFTRLDPGYVDNIATGQRGEGLTKEGGGRVAGMWTPTPDFSMKLGFLYEKSDRYGSDDVVLPTAGFPQSAGLGGLQQNYMPGTGGLSQEFKIASLNVNANLGGVKLTAISGYTVNGFVSRTDFSWTSPYPYQYGVPLLEDNQVHKFTQEVRLTDTIGSHLEWLLGGFYTLEDSRYNEYSSEANLTTGAVAVPGDLFYLDTPDRYREYAGFGALTWKMTDQFDVQFGVRETFLSNPELSAGTYYGGSDVNAAPGPSVYLPPSSEIYKANAFTYLVSPRYKLTPEVMVYARVANGFRPGSGVVNPQPTDICVEEHYQCLINPDKTTDYEIGSKADFFDRTLSIDSSVYYIRWTDLQVDLTGANHINHLGNGSGAKSQGVDLSVEWRALEGLTVSSWGAWNEAVLTQSFAYASAGQPMPLAARFSGNLAVEKDFLITSYAHAVFAAREIYMGDRLGSFTNLGAPRQDLPAYSQTNLNAGIKTSPWKFNLYVNNATDRRGLVNGGLGSAFGPLNFNYITPRTIGISVDRTF